MHSMGPGRDKVTERQVNSASTRLLSHRRRCRAQGAERGARLEGIVAGVGVRLVALQDRAPRQRGPAALAQHAPQLVRGHLAPTG